MPWLIGLTLGVVLCVALAYFGVPDLFRRRPRTLRATPEWEDLGPTPLGERGFTPQGLTVAGDRLVFANTWKDERSRVYLFALPQLQPAGSFDMPPEARHTSGFGFDGTSLWAVDYRSNLIYVIDLAASLAAGGAVVRSRIETGLRGASALEVAHIGGCDVLFVSDYMHTKRTYVIDRAAALDAGSMRPAVLWSYRNEAYSQGLLFAGGFLFEAENKAGRDVVNRLSLDALQRTGSARAATTVQFAAPGRGVEDLATDGEFVYTSDEHAYRFYRTPLAPLTAAGSTEPR